MKRIEEKAYLKEKREEKRIFISWLITISLMLASGIGYFGWSYHEQFTALFHRAKDSVPDAKTLLLCLPTAIALLLLFFLQQLAAEKNPAEDRKPMNRWSAAKDKDTKSRNVPCAFVSLHSMSQTADNPVNDDSLPVLRP